MTDQNLRSRIEAWGKEKISATAATDESVQSQLPGRENGPADAYRHILWAAELTRRFGEPTARVILDAHEIDGSSSSRAANDRQSPDAEAMDRHNNELGIALGKRTPRWEDVVKGARETMDSSKRDGSPRRRMKAMMLRTRMAKMMTVNWRIIAPTCRHMSANWST